MKKGWIFTLFLIMSLQNLDLQFPTSAPTGSLFINQIQETSIYPNQNLSHTSLMKMKVRISAYSSTIDQTDGTPFITASGEHVHDGIIAANFLKFGTRVKIPELFGDKVFIVEDRMASRYFHQIDIWFSNKSAARRFGIQETKIEIL